MILGVGLWLARRAAAEGMQRQRARRGKDSQPNAGDYLTAYVGPLFVVAIGVAAIIHGALTV